MEYLRFIYGLNVFLIMKTFDLIIGENYYDRVKKRTKTEKK